MTAPTPNPRRILSLSCTAHVVQDGLISAIYVLLPILAQAFGLSYAQVGILKGLKGIIQATLEIGSGWLSERVGLCQLIAIGLALSGVGYLLLSAAPGAVVIAICLPVIGAGTALHHAPSSALIAGAYPGCGAAVRWAFTMRRAMSANWSLPAVSAWASASGWPGNRSVSPTDCLPFWPPC